MNIALSTDTRRRRFDNVVIADARIVDRREQWRDKREAHDSEQLREAYIRQSANRAAYEYGLQEVLDHQDPVIEF